MQIKNLHAVAFKTVLRQVAAMFCQVTSFIQWAASIPEVDRQNVGIVDQEIVHEYIEEEVSDVQKIGVTINVHILYPKSEFVCFVEEYGTRRLPRTCVQLS